MSIYNINLDKNSIDNYGKWSKLKLRMVRFFACALHKY